MKVNYASPVSFFFLAYLDKIHQEAYEII